MCPSVDAVFLGDAFTTRSVLTGRARTTAGAVHAGPARAKASLAKLDGIEATWVLPGHGEPWNGGLAEALRLIRAVA